jgi:hypothetical protein
MLLLLAESPADRQASAVAARALAAVAALLAVVLITSAPSFGSDGLNERDPALVEHPCPR